MQKIHLCIIYLTHKINNQAAVGASRIRWRKHRYIRQHRRLHDDEIAGVGEGIAEAENGIVVIGDGRTETET